MRVVSKFLETELVEKMDVNSSSIHVCPVPVTFRPHPVSENKKKYRERIGLKEDGPVVLYVGRFSKEKNLGMWVNIALRILNACPDAQFVLVGEGEERDRIQRIVAEKSSNRFHFMGSVDYDQLSDYYGAADVFLLCSRYEGYGRVIIEAGLAGVPVVSTRVASAAALIEDGKTGFLEHCEDETGLVNSVMSMLTNDGQRRAMGLKARQKVHSEQSNDAISNRLVHVWGSLMEGAVLEN